MTRCDLVPIKTPNALARAVLKWGGKCVSALKTCGGHVPGTAFPVGLQFVRVPWGSCSPCKALAPLREGGGENSHGCSRVGPGWMWCYNRPTTISGCSCARKYEKQYRVLVPLVECNSHVRNIWWAPCHEPPAPSGWGGQCCHPLNVALLQKPP